MPPVAGLGDRPAAAAALAAGAAGAAPVIEVLGGARVRALIPVLGATGRVQLAFGALFAAGLWISSLDGC